MMTPTSHGDYVQGNGQSPNTVFITATRFDPSYVRTPPGILKVAVIILNILGFICVMCSAFRSNGRGVYFCIVCHTSLWFSVSMLVTYVWHMVECHHNFPWLKLEMVVYTVFTFLYLIASTIAVAFGDAAYSAAGFFGYLAMVLYGVDGFLKAKSLKAGDLAQGHRVFNKQTTAPASP